MNYLFQKKKKYLYLITPPNLLKKELLLDEFLIVLNKPWFTFSHHLKDLYSTLITN